MIKNFGDKDTESLFINGKSGKYPPEIIKTALRKLDYLNAAKSIEDLMVPPGNRLEKLKGNLRGMYSIRINNQYRIIFRLTADIAEEVKIIDYHS
ncbi:MAG: type II toxin-antitoxin system RelE/ParE family toxin [Ignavibacteria bacterium]|jgi:proteic killer suppression protein